MHFYNRCLAANGLCILLYTLAESPSSPHARWLPPAAITGGRCRLRSRLAAHSAWRRRWRRRRRGRAALRFSRSARLVVCARRVIAAFSPPRPNAVRWQSMNLATRLGSLLKYVLPFSPVLPYPSRFLFRRFYPCFWGGGGGTLPAAPPRGGFEAGDGSARTPMRGGRGRALAWAADEGRCMLRAQECLSASSLLTNAHALALWTDANCGDNGERIRTGVSSDTALDLLHITEQYLSTCCEPLTKVFPPHHGVVTTV